MVIVMNEKMVLGQYYNGDSLIHRLDPRTKIFALIVMMVVTFLIPFNNFILLGSFFAIIFVVICLTRVPIIKYLKSLRQIGFLLIFSFIFQIFSKTSGTILLTLNLQFSYINIIVVLLTLIIYIFIKKYIPTKLLLFIGIIVLSFYLFTIPMGVSPFAEVTLRIYDSGVISGSFIIGRVLAIILVSTVLTLTTKPMDLSSALEWYMKPFEIFKLKPSILAMMISIALRFIPTLFNETNKILKAQASRGVDFKEGKLHERIGQIISLLIPMFVISFKRAVDLADAMEARGYIPGAKRTRLLKMSFSFRDLISLILILLILGFVIFWRVAYAY